MYKIKLKKIGSAMLRLLAAIGLMTLALGIQTAFAQTGGIGMLDKIIQGSGLPDFTARFHALSSTEPGADIITSVIFFIIDMAKYALGTVAVLFIIWSGLRLVTAEVKIEEISEKEKDNLKYIIYGLIFVIVADELVTKVFFGDYGECLASASNAAECGKQGSSIFKGIYSLVLAIVASLSVMVMVISGFRLIVSYGEEETLTKQKNRILMSIIGLIVAGVAEFVFKGLIFRDGGTKPIDVLGVQRLVFNFTNFVSSFIGAGAFIMLCYGGWLYVSSFGNEEETGKAKKILMSSAVGIAVALAGFGIIATLQTFVAPIALTK
jgi:hypothetical protein